MKMKILRIDSSALGSASVSRQLTAAIVDALRATEPTATIVYRDLAAAPPAHLNGELLQALRPQPGVAPTLSVTAQDDLKLTDVLLDEFLAADVVVVGAPMYNFSVPTPLKAWIDRIAQAGKTFRYTAAGPQGLAGGKKVVIASSRGSLIAGSAAETALDHQEAYLRTVFNFLGVTDVSFVRAEGLAISPEQREQSIANAHREIGGLQQTAA
jgi:FMN-dependent NADH-azoreductase